MLSQLHTADVFAVRSWRFPMSHSSAPSSQLSREAAHGNRSQCHVYVHKSACELATSSCKAAAFVYTSLIVIIPSTTTRIHGGRSFTAKMRTSHPFAFYYRSNIATAFVHQLICDVRSNFSLHSSPLLPPSVPRALQAVNVRHDAYYGDVTSAKNCQTNVWKVNRSYPVPF